LGSEEHGAGGWARIAGEVGGDDCRGEAGEVRRIDAASGSSRLEHCTGLQKNRGTRLVLGSVWPGHEGPVKVVLGEQRRRETPVICSGGEC
jgi:hypothetical protein